MNMGKLIQFTLTLLVLVVAIALRGFDPAVMSSLRGAGFDTLQRIWPRQLAEPQPVRIIDINEASLKQFGQWPWPRTRMAEMVTALDELGAATTSFDIMFPEADRMSPAQLAKDPAFQDLFTGRTTPLRDSDAEFAAAISGKRVVAAMAAASAGTDPATLPAKAGFSELGASAKAVVQPFAKVTANLPVINTAAAGLGAINLDLAVEQGVARQVPFLWSDGTRYYPSLVAESLRVAQGHDSYLVVSTDGDVPAVEALRVGDVPIPLADDGTFYIHYRPNDPSMFVSAADLLSPEKREGLRPLIEGHIVFVGTSSVGLLDTRTTALGEAVPGVSIHAQATEQILSGRFLSRPDWLPGLELLFPTLLSVLMAWACAWAKPWHGFVVGAVGMVANWGFAIFAFLSLGLLYDATFPALASTFVFLAGTAYRLFVTDREGRAMRRIFGHYVSPTVMADIERNPQKLKLGGEVRDVTVMFADIVNFTPLSEKLSPEELVQTVNGLWNACSKTILQEQGTIDKFIGDAVMAFWNAPLPVEDHQWRAARAAIGLRKAVAAYNDSPALVRLREERGLPSIGLRIGLASGPACVGNMGSAERFDYSVLGDTVNIAARTEATGKQAAHDILIAGNLAPKTAGMAVLQAGHMPMKGKSKPEPVHALLGDEAEAEGHAFRELKVEHDHIAQQLAQNPQGHALSAIEQLLGEMALRHPVCGPYLTAMAHRAVDFADFKPV